MNVNTSKLYSQILSNLETDNLFPCLDFHTLDAIDIDDKCLVPSWQIRDALINPDKSPYFWKGYKGVSVRWTFYSVCFFAFVSGIMFSVVKKGNIVNQWNYWWMHKHLSSNFILESITLEQGIALKNRNTIDLIKGDIDVEGIQMYSLIYWTIHNYFPYIGVQDFDLFDDELLPINRNMVNIDDVLEIFHRAGCACHEIASYKVDDGRIRGKCIWGGPGMSQIYNYAH